MTLCVIEILLTASNRDLSSSLAALQTAAENLLAAAEDISGYDLDVGATEAELRALANKVNGMGSDSERIQFLRGLATKAASAAENALSSLSQADQDRLKGLFTKVVSAAKDVINEYV